MKKIMCLILIVFLSGCSIFTSKVEIIFSEESTLEYGDEFCPSQYIVEIKNGELANPQECRKIQALGEVELEVDIKSKSGETKTVLMNITIQDTKGPEIEYAAIVEQYVGTRFNLLKAVNGYDLVDGAVVVDVLGDWNSQSVGEYPLQYQAIDSNGNQTVVDFLLKIKRGGTRLNKHPIIKSESR